MSGGGWRATPQRKIRPPKEGEVVDIGAKFGITLGSDSDSSDAEFAVEDVEPDSEVEYYGADSVESSGESESEGGDEGEGPNVEETKPKEEEGGEGVASSEKMMTGGEESSGKGVASAGKGEESAGKGEGVAEKGEGSVEKGKGSADDEYNPLIVRRSQRAIKPTKDIDLYLLSVKFGVTLDDSDGADSSDAEFDPVESDAGSLSDSSLSDGEEGGMAGAVESEREDTAKQTYSGSKAAAGQSEDEQDMSRSVSELSVLQAPHPKTVDIPVCCVCLEDSKDEGDIVECDHCGISVHEGCYGVPEEDGVDDLRSDLSSFTTIPWFCDLCKAGKAPLSCACELCPNMGGLMKQTVNGRWVHMVCSLYTPGIEYVEPDLLSGVTLDKVPANKWGARTCLLCEDEQFSKTGICIGCDAGLCKSVFHVTCAQQHGLLCEVDSEDEEKYMADPYFAHCKAHSDKDLAKRKRRDFLTVMTKQKKFKFDDTDDRILHHLNEAENTYVAFFKKMQQYYRPEDACRKREERFLHFLPSALRRLTQKAQLLGYAPEGVGSHGDSRKKVAPNLTCDFVNYFSARQFRMKSLREQGDQLRETKSELKKQELKMKEQLARLEKELNSARVQGHEVNCQATAIYVNLSRTTKENLTLPDFLTEGELKDDQQAIEGEHSCAVCEKSHDSHMMALCDTCGNHYHIGCLDPPLSKVPKKTSRWGWQCHKCCFSSGDELIPTIAGFDEMASRCGRRIQPPKTLLYPEEQIKTSTKKTKPKKSKPKT